VKREDSYEPQLSYCNDCSIKFIIKKWARNYIKSWHSSSVRGILAINETSTGLGLGGNKLLPINENKAYI